MKKAQKKWSAEQERWVHEVCISIVYRFPVVKMADVIRDLGRTTKGAEEGVQGFYKEKKQGTKERREGFQTDVFFNDDCSSSSCGRPIE